MATIASTLKSLYEDKCTGKLPEAVFYTLMGDFSKEQGEIEERLPKLPNELESIKEATGEIEEWLSLISSYLKLETIDRATVMGLLERITVSERVKVDGKNNQELEIEYRFIKNILTRKEKDVA